MDDDDIDELPDGTEVSQVEPKSAKPWLNLIAHAESVFSDYNERCDNIDKLYANLARLANPSRDRAMALFWANMQTLQPSIYARPPVPVVMPRFKDRRPVPRTASELLERSLVVSFETSRIDRTLKLVRDGLARLSRGVAWQRYETKQKGAYGGRKVCIEYKFRRDFVHDPARCWDEVDWVAGAAYLSKSEMRKRFRKPSGNVYQDAAYAVRKDAHDTTTDRREKAKVWELWSKSANKVVWVAEGCDKVLDESEPHLELDEFFPCPEPAYGTTEPDSLIPVPDVLQYRDQLEEINELTARIAALAEAVKVRGFYPAGAGEIGDAVEAAMKVATDNVTLIPVSNWAMLGDGNASNMVLWWPIEQVVRTIAQLVELRQQLIQDVYEISGISDILRGQSDPNETLGAQELKAQTGSTRIRDKQEEIVRLARDMTRITAEIMAENFDGKALLEMAQMELPTDAEVKRKVDELARQGERLKRAVDEAMSDPEVRAQAEQNPEEARQAIEESEKQAQALQAQIAETAKTVTIDQVMGLLKDQRLRPFVLDIETDSTIVPDENAQKRRATEYIASMTGLFQQAVPAIQSVPESAPLLSEIIKFANSQFRVGREFAQVVEEFTDQMKQMASAPKPPAPEMMKAQAEAQKTAAEVQEKQVSNAERQQALASKEADDKLSRDIREQEALDASVARNQEIADKRAMAELERSSRAEEHHQKMEHGRLELSLMGAKITQAEVQTDATVAKANASVASTAAKAAQPQPPNGAGK